MRRSMSTLLFAGFALSAFGLLLAQAAEKPGKPRSTAAAAKPSTVAAQSPSESDAAGRQALAEAAWKARLEAAGIEAARSAAEKSVASKSAQIKSEQSKIEAARKAQAEATSAQKALEAAPEEKKSAAKKALKTKEAAAQKAGQAAAASAQTIEKLRADKEAAEKALAAESARLDDALDAAAAAHAKALGGLTPITARQWDYAKARHLLFRAGYGGTPEEIQKLVKMGPHKAVEHIVEYHQRPMANIEVESDIYSWQRPLAYEKALGSQALSQLEEVDGKRNVDQHAVMLRWWVRRLLESPRPMEEKLVLFWHDHFASSYRTLGDTHLMYQQNQFFRRYADNFEALLHGIVQDPAMIRYLNNDDNVAGNHNENFGRELLELFSLGEENGSSHRSDGYSEKDVRDGNTRSLSGATFEHYSGQFRYYETRHDPTPKTLLGKTGNWGIHEAADIILEHPATAQYVVKKLWQYLASWEPEPRVVERLSRVLRENGYAMRPMLSNLLLSEEFYSDRSMGGHIKSPVELLVGTAKVLNLSKLSYQDIRFLLGSMGQNLFDPPSVAGWAEGRDWINTNLLMARYTAVSSLLKQAKPDLVALLKDYRLQNAQEVVEHLERRCLTIKLGDAKRQELIDFLGKLPPSEKWEEQTDAINAKLRAALMLLMSSPEYQVS